VRILVVLAGYEISCEFLSYKIAPVSASMRMALPDVISGASGHSSLVDEVVESVEVVAALAVMVSETENATLPATIAPARVMVVMTVMNFFNIYFIDRLRY
jgi:hypothetical protein